MKHRITVEVKYTLADEYKSMILDQATNTTYIERLNALIRKEQVRGAHAVSEKDVLVGSVQLMPN